MEQLAEQLNQTIQAEAPALYEMLSEVGKEMYFPSKGILSQSAEAKTKAKRFNATIGTALENGEAMHLDCLMSQLPGISPDAALLYAPSPGLPDLRKAWQEKLLHDNPDLKDKVISLPIVTSGLTHALSLIGDAFIDKGDALIYPDKNWGNYALNYVVRHGAKPVYFPLFSGENFNLDGLKDSLKKTQASGAHKAVVLLNFPNNPTGYAPTEDECVKIAEILLEAAENGMKLVVIIDDAYYSLFHKEKVFRQSLFTKLAGKHRNLLAIKADAATKEVYVWGLRVGFLTFSIGGIASATPVLEALNAKIGGFIRAGISNCSALSQRLVLNALRSPDFYKQRAEKAAIMKERALEMERVLREPKYSEAWTEYPFNSGYFMCLHINKISARDLRVYLLDKYGVGTIAINDTDLRIAFSCIKKEDVQELFDTILQAWQELAK